MTMEQMKNYTENTTLSNSVDAPVSKEIADNTDNPKTLSQVGEIMQNQDAAVQSMCC